MATAVKFDCFSEDLAEKVHNLGSDQMTIALTNSAPSASSNTVLADITQITYTNLSSRNVTRTSSSQTGGLYKLVLQDLILTASGGSVGPFRYVVLYNSTAAGGPLMQYYDYGSSITLADGETFTIDFDATNGAVQL